MKQKERKLSEIKLKGGQIVLTDKIIESMIENRINNRRDRD